MGQETTQQLWQNHHHSHKQMSTITAHKLDCVKNHKRKKKKKKKERKKKKKATLFHLMGSNNNLKNNIFLLNTN